LLYPESSGCEPDELCIISNDGEFFFCAVLAAERDETASGCAALDRDRRGVAAFCRFSPAVVGVFFPGKHQS